MFIETMLSINLIYHLFDPVKRTVISHSEEETESQRIPETESLPEMQ